MQHFTAEVIYDLTEKKKNNNKWRGDLKETTPGPILSQV